jgi:hypothetical protein
VNPSTYSSSSRTTTKSRSETSEVKEQESTVDNLMILVSIVSFPSPKKIRIQFVDLLLCVVTRMNERELQQL